MNDGPTTFQTVVFTIWTVLQVIGVLATIAMIGRPRKPITSSQAAYAMFSVGLWIALFWWAFIL